ncbi:MAG: ATP-binding cassette domain-containing protein [Alphaproteobacteria bacterium]|nr:ATP-binding cassette domain-containing protein [Alphaproteobacteria bacterium]
MLDIDGLASGYGARPVARLGHLTLAPGEAALLTGPSGSGKTTLLLAIAGLARRHAGRATVGGIDLHDLPPARRDRFRGRSIGFVFQDLHLVTGLSALDNVLLAPYAAGAPQDRARALALLGELGLGGLAHAAAARLSRGQAQRVAIARAVLQKPKLILADEPTASLDDEAAAAVCDLLLAAAAANGAALVIATHDRRLRERIARQVAIEALP